MSAPQPRLLETYNSLTDKHLVGYFSNARIRRHLQKSGLISRSGRIIPEKEYRLNAIRRDHQRHVRECLADAIFRKVLDMERHHQRDKKKKPDCSGRRNRRKPDEEERIRESLEEIIHVRCPHPPLAPRNHHGLCPFVAAQRACCPHCRAPGLGVDCCVGHCPLPHRIKETYSSKVSSLRPSTAPGKARRLRGRAAAGAGAAPRKGQALERQQQCARGGNSSEIRIENSVEYIPVSPYQLPALCPRAPPRQRRGDRRVPALRGALPAQGRLNPTTAFNEQVLIRNTRGFPKSPLCSNALVTMIYLGRSKHVSLEFRDEIKVYQQYCGTENICVYRGELMEGDTFQFVSKRHLGFPFSLTFFLNDTEVERLSSCCEFRHLRRPGPRRRNSYFRILHVAGAPPCYKCIVAMGLDKKSSPPKRKARSSGMKRVCPWEHAVHCQLCDSSAEPTSREDSSSVVTHGHGTSAETVEKSLETEEESSEEEMENQSSEEEEDSDENGSKNEYDEDFETYEEVNEEGQTGDQMNGMSKSPSDDKNHSLGCGKESEPSSQKALGASDREKDGSDGYCDDRASGDDLQERGPADSASSLSTQCSTQTASHAEMVTENVNGQQDCSFKSASDSAAHAHCGNQSGEKELLRMEENQETSALEKKGIDEAEKTKPEDLTAREDTRISHENIMSMQHQNHEVNGEFKQTGPGEGNRNEEEKRAAVPWGRRALDTEDGSEECPRSEEGAVFEDCKPVQEEVAKASGNDHPVNSDPEPDSCASEEEKSTANAEHGASGAPGGSSLAEGRRSRAEQEAAGQEAREGQVIEQGQALEQDGAAEAGAGAAGAGAALEESAPEDGAGAQEHPRGKGTGEAGGRSGTGMAPGEQEALLEGMETEAKPAARGQGPAGALPGREAHRAEPQGLEGAGNIAEEEEAAEEERRGAEEQAGEAVSEAGQAGPDTEVGAVPPAGEAAGAAGTAAGGTAGAAGEGAAEKGISEGDEAVGKPGCLWEALGGVETGGAMPGEEGFVKPSEFSQLKAPGEERMEMGKAGAAAAESAQAREVGGNALHGAGDTMERSVEPDKDPVLEVAPELGALGAARGDPGAEGSSQAEETRAEQEEEGEDEEGAAEILWSGNPKSEGSKAETQRAVEGKAAGEAVGGSAAGSGGEEESADGAAGSEEPAAGTEGRPRSAKGTGQGRCPGEPGLCGTRAGEPGLVAIAVLGGQAGRGDLAGELAMAMGPAMAGELALAGGTAIAKEPAMAGELALAMGPALVPGPAMAMGPALAGEPALAPGPAMAMGPALAGELALAGGPAIAEEPALAGELAVAGELALAGGPAIAKEPAVAGTGRLNTGGMAQEAVTGAVLGAQSGTAAEEQLGTPRHGEGLGAASLGEQPSAGGSPDSPAPGDGAAEPGGTGGPGGEGLCPGTQPGTARGRDGRQEQGLGQAAGEAEGQQGRDSPLGGSPGLLAAAGTGESSRGARQASPACGSRDSGCASPSRS